MRPNAGKRDTLITFQAGAEATNATYGTKSYTWSDLASNPQEFADVSQMLGSERMAEGLDLTKQPARVDLLWRDDITPQMRVVIDGVTHRIVRGPIELGRRDGMRLVVEVMSTEGEQP